MNTNPSPRILVFWLLALALIGSRLWVASQYYNQSQAVLKSLKWSAGPSNAHSGDRTRAAECRDKTDEKCLLAGLESV